MRTRSTGPGMRRRLAVALLAAAALLGVLAGPASAQTSSPFSPAADRPAPRTAAPPAAELPEDHSPRGALWRAAVVPGWGQYYNRQYYKIPLVYLGLVGVTAATLYTNYRYLLYRHAYHYAVWWEDGRSRFPEYEDDFLRVLRINGVPPERAEEVRARLAPDFRRVRDDLRRNRDLLYVGIGLFYGFTVLDAYVNAHLLDFDVGEDLTISMHPVPFGLAASVRMAR